ncbi:ABC transporter permease [Cellulomonas soli]|nr:ABC transporter permease [Cellulomonas soli]NYI59226.1 ABC-type transport system involved in multi-copper enzyme maturation permease subunit [Cellulomonas soli]
MSTVTLDEHQPPEESGPVLVPPTRRSPWSMTWHGVRTVAVLDLRQRVRSTRWAVALVAWFLVVGAITLLSTGAISSTWGSSGSRAEYGPLLFGVVTFLVLGLGLLVTPTLTSTAVNGDRNAGTLATLQVTLLTPAEIAMGKLLAAWVASLAFLAISVPFLALALAFGGTPVWAIVRVVVLVALLLVAVCGIGIGFSALTARTAGSTVLTFVAVATLTIFSLIFYAVTFPSITTTEQVRVYGTPATWDYSSNDIPECEWSTESRDVMHTERTWWLLGINPFVIVADGAGTGDLENRTDPLAGIRDGVRTLRAGPDPELDECWTYGNDSTADDVVVQRAEPTSTPVWPWGLAFNLLLGAGGFAVAVRRLTVPQRVLPRGTRVA